MEKIRVPSDVVKAIFHFLGPHFRFPADVPIIHEVFYKLAEKTEFFEIFKDFIFDTSKMYPYCTTIRYALDRLQKSDLLACINPGLDEFEISENLASLSLEKSALFDEEEIKTLKDAAQEFKTLMAYSNAL